MEPLITETTNKQLTLEYAAASWQNHRHKKYQEDKITCVKLQNGHFFGVYDGHASYRTDDNVSSFLQENLHKLFEQSEKETIQEKLEDAFYQADIHALTNFTDGSTAVVAYINENNMLHLAWVGDSRAVLEKNNTIAYATKDHDTYNSSEVERIKAHNLSIEDHYICNRSNEYTLAMSRSIGDIKHKEITPDKPLGTGGIIAIPEYHAIQLTPENNFLILATDGLWFDVDNIDTVQLTRQKIKNPMDNFTSQTLQKQFPMDFAIESSKCDKSITSAAQYLGVTALRKGSTDNIGIIIAQLKWQLHSSQTCLS